MKPGVPPYFDDLIDGFQRGEGGRFVHLGYWERPPSTDRRPLGGEFETAQERLNDILLAMADLHDGQVVLDVGCGFGGTAERINERHRDMHITGVNVDLRQLDICREIEARNGNELRWELADACELPFPDAGFDRVLCIEAMFHFPSRRRFFEQAARVLRPGGVLVASDIVLTRPGAHPSAPVFPIEASLQEGFGPWPDLWGTDADHRRLGDDAGLQLERVHDATLETTPSHRFTVPGNADDQRDPGDPTMRASMALRWLHREGYLEYLNMRFSKPPTATTT